MLRNKLPFFFFAVNPSTKIHIFKPNNVVALHDPCLPPWFQGMYCKHKPWVAAVLPVGPGSFPSLAVLHAAPAQRREYSWLRGGNPCYRLSISSFEVSMLKSNVLYGRNVWQNNDSKRLNYSWGIDQR